MKRVLIFALAAALTAALFTGCSRSQASAPQRVVYWSMWNEAEPQGQVIARAAEAFQSETGIEIDINFNGRDIRRTLQPALDAGEPIDLFEEDIERVVNSWGNYLLPLDDYMGRTYPTTNGMPFSSVINQTLLNIVRGLSNGTVRQVPYQPSTQVVLYNKDLFERAGITSVPTNWDQLLDACARLKAIDVYGFTIDDAYMALFFGYNMVRLVGLDATLAMVQNNDFTGPQVLEFGRRWQNMVEQGYIIPKAAANVFPAGQVEDFAPGRAAMYLNGTWLPNEIRGNAPNMRWGQFAYPAMTSAEFPNGDGIEANGFGAQSFAINRNSQVADAAFQFIVYMTTGRWDEELARETIGIPIANDSEWPEQLADAKAIVDSTTKRLPWASGMEDNPEINTKIKENFAKLITREFNAEQFAAAMAR